MRWKKKAYDDGNTDYISDNGFYIITHCKVKPLKMTGAFEFDTKDIDSPDGWYWVYSLDHVDRDGMRKAMEDYDTLEEAKAAAEEHWASLLQWTHDGHKWVAEDYSVVEYKTVYVLYYKDMILSSISWDRNFKYLFDRAEKHRKMVRETLAAMRKRKRV